MFNFLLRKDVRKILKRKDSDAGERGRALEELRGSLFNEFRSSEGAKRQQQRTCGPAAALSFNFVVAVGIIFMNKMVLQTVNFKFPILLSLIHYVVSWFLMAVLNVCSVFPASPPSKSTQLSALFTLGFVMSLSTGLANVSLKYNSVGFYQMAKIAVTPSIVMAEFVLFGKKVSWPKALALAVVSIGVAVATVTDLQFHVFGACVALAWILPSAVNKILWSRLQQQENWTALALMWKTTPITLIFLAAMLPCLDPPGVLSFDWNLSNTLVILASAILGFLLQWSGALALGATSAVSHVVLGQFKTCIILLGNYYIFGSNPGIISICGAFTAIAGMSVYTFLNLKQQSNKIFPRQTSLLPKSKLSKENGSSHNGHYSTESSANSRCGELGQKIKRKSSDEDGAPVEASSKLMGVRILCWMTPNPIVTLVLSGPILKICNVVWTIHWFRNEDLNPQAQEARSTAPLSLKLIHTQKAPTVSGCIMFTIVFTQTVHPLCLLKKCLKGTKNWDNLHVQCCQFQSVNFHIGNKKQTRHPFGLARDQRPIQQANL
ncbi:hypothetical protein VNO77_23898 [Canavalia gladiata]|uniref:Sugar phosphate transporter domain-containing protein n=1 Tax=Canavalia gladiata TaxID=3824 RepID=A0AAN9L7R3_CANGL